MTLSSDPSEFKTCLNCHGDGYESNPPMRRCTVCEGAGRVPDHGPYDDRCPDPSEAHAGVERRERGVSG